MFNRDQNFELITSREMIRFLTLR